MKHLLLIAGLIYSSLAMAQFNYSEDFESFEEGDYLGVVSPSWTTWSGTTGGTEDVTVTSENAYSGNHSTFYASTAANGGPQDVVLEFGQLFSSGDFNFSAYFFVNPNAGAYFNFQAEEEVGNTWALDCNMNTNGTLVFSTGGGATEFLSTTYPIGEWFKLSFSIDLTANIWSVSLNDTEQGSFTNTVNQVASLDIFPLQGHQFYIDDITVEHIPALLTSLDVPAYVQSPIEVEIGGSIYNYGTEAINSFDVIWTDGTDSYTSNFTNLDIAPMTSYDFVCTDLLSMPNPTIEELIVTAQNVNGTTDFDEINNEIEHTIQSYEYVTQKIPLYEHFTSNTCGPCASFNPGFQDLLDANNVNSIVDGKTNAIKYQVNYPGAADQSFNDEVDQRHTYYGVTGVPTAHIDGVVTGSSQTNLDQRSAIPCFLDINGTAVTNDGLNVEVNATISSFSDDYQNTKLYIAIVENEYYNNLGSNGETQFYQVHRKMMPSTNGLTVNLSNGSTVEIIDSTTFTIGDVVANSYNLWQGLDNCVVIAFVQNDNTKEVYQSKVIEITGNTVASIVESNELDLSIMPNPASNTITMSLGATDQNVQVSIHSITGQKITQLSVEKSSNTQNIPMDISSLNSGVYTITLITNNTKLVRKFIKK
jgi:thiol-disulfide isomerase/thioredoxin